MALEKLKAQPPLLAIVTRLNELIDQANQNQNLATSLSLTEQQFIEKITYEDLSNYSYTTGLAGEYKISLTSETGNGTVNVKVTGREETHSIILNPGESVQWLLNLNDEITITPSGLLRTSYVEIEYLGGVLSYLVDFSNKLIEELEKSESLSAENTRLLEEAKSLVGSLNLNNYVRKEEGKGLSDINYTAEEKSKVDSAIKSIATELTSTALELVTTTNNDVATKINLPIVSEDGPGLLSPSIKSTIDENKRKSSRAVSSLSRTTTKDRITLYGDRHDGTSSSVFIFNATASRAGLMTADDKAKLDGTVARSELTFMQNGKEYLGKFVIENGQPKIVAEEVI